MRSGRVGAVVAVIALLAPVVGVNTAIGAPGPAAPTLAWTSWKPLPGIVDLAGPRGDGRLVAAVDTKLVLLSPSGATTAFAPAYAVPGGHEPYIALSPGVAIDGAGCSFAPDEVLALDVGGQPQGITAISPDGAVSHLATVPGVTLLSGITLDTVGTFGHRLLVIGAVAPGKTLVSAVDCRGRVTSIGTVDTALEGGIAVAPRTFGAFGGQLVAADEVDGGVYAVSTAGRLSRVASPAVAKGQDIGVESAGFVPATGAAEAYLSDRGDQGQPHTGTNSVLRLSGVALSVAGVRPGDLLVATEGGATLAAVHCAATCTSTVIATGPVVAHAEGRLLVTAGSLPVGRGSGSTAVVIVVVVVVVLAGLALVVVRRRRTTP